MVLERTTEVDGRRVRHLEAGAGRPVVLIHAFPLSADMWRSQLERVPDGWRLLAPDLPGFGPHADGSVQSMDDMARRVEAWMTAAGIDRAVIGGVSMGGYVTLALFRLAPGRFTGVVLANTKAGADTAEGRAARDAMSALVREQGAAAVADQMLPKLLGETTRRSRPDLETLVRGLIAANRPDGIAGAIGAMKGRPDSTALLAQIDRPALVIAGSEDTLIPASEAALLHERLPSSRLVTIPGAGHLSSLEAPDEFSAALAAFLSADA